MHYIIEQAHAKILVSTLEAHAKCHEVKIMVKLLIIHVTEYTPQNRASDTIMHVTIKIP